MRLLEFYDKTAIENIVGTLLCRPDEVIFLGENRKQMEKSIVNYAEVAKKQGLCVRFFARSIPRNDLKSAVETLSALVQEADECVIDLCGGEELLLTAAGIVFERFPQKVRLRRFNVYTNVVTDCDANGVVSSERKAELDVEDIVRICGGRAICSGKRPVDAECERELAELWAICRADPSRWNAQINVLGATAKGTEGSLHAAIPRPSASRDTEKQRRRFDRLLPFLEDLSDKGLLRNLHVDEDGASFSYKNERVKSCLLKAGRVLELVIAHVAHGLSDEDGTPLYTDVRSGVTLDWDGKTAPFGEAEVANEIDVLLTKGLIPVFISCKNGQVDTDELYKLSVVAERFGGEYAQKVLVVNEPEALGSHAKYIRVRCREMGIRLLENIDRMTYEELAHILRSLWETDV